MVESRRKCPICNLDSQTFVVPLVLFVPRCGPGARVSTRSNDRTAQGPRHDTTEHSTVLRLFALSCPSVIAADKTVRAPSVPN
jgi:hypothetical protein